MSYDIEVRKIAGRWYRLCADVYMPLHITTSMR